MPCTRYPLTDGGSAIVCTRGSARPDPAAVQREVDAGRRELAAVEGRALGALTLQQPWASCIIQGPKRVENRTWAPPRHMELSEKPRWMAIHAGKKDYEFEMGYWAGLRQLWPEMPGPRDWPRGAILGLARLVRAEHYACEADAAIASPWCVGPWGWWFDRVIPLEQPLPCKGAQGIWAVPEELLPPLRETYRRAQS